MWWIIGGGVFILVVIYGLAPFVLSGRLSEYERVTAQQARRREARKAR